MGATLEFEPVRRKRYSIPTTAPSSFMGTLEHAFGKRTPTLSRQDIPKLEGMMAVESGFESSYKALIDGIEKFDEIEVVATY